MIYDFLIVGGGCAGASAAMYAARLNMKCLVLAEMSGGLITTTHLVENWPGEISISGPDLAANLINHAKAFGVEMKSERVGEIKKEGQFFTVKTKRNEYQAKSVLIATGTKHRKMDVLGEERLANKGVSYCALCDGAFFKEQDIVICGSGDSAAKEALLLADYGRKVYLISKYEKLKGEAPNVQGVMNHPKIELVAPAKVAEIIGENSVEAVILEDGKRIDCKGVFVAIGHIPLSDLALELGVSLNEKKEIIINRRSETNVEGVYAAGDVCDTQFKQAIIGSAEGVTAAYFASEYVKNLKL
jgi:thioredoxin reductase (NADPH)